ncbi:MAG: hypothetical protein IPJ69_12310 [Deltaproteobacteria bacterium]|nr:MAG: hypothetical protein IPJ69_12310 [Deltaproteobacteria bacterium]
MTSPNSITARVLPGAVGIAAYTQPLEALAQAAPVLTGTNYALDALMTLTYTVPVLRLLARGFRPILPDDLRKQMNPERSSALAYWNERFGRMDSKLSPWRALLMPFIAYAYGSHPAQMAAAAVLGSTLAALDHSNRVENAIIKNQMAAGAMLTMDAWERFEHNALGVLGADVPKEFEHQDLLENNMPRYGEGVERIPSEKAFYAGLLNTASTIFGLARRTSVHAEGFVQTVVNIATVFMGGKAKATPEFTQAIGYALGYWAQRQARIYKMSMTSQGFDNLINVSKGTPIFHALYGHTMWTNYTLFALRPLIRFMANISNFRNNRAAKMILFSWLMDVLALPPAIKQNGDNTNKDSQTEAFNETVNNVEKLGIEPAVFVQGGRAPRVYRDNGTLDIPTMYDNVVKLEHPERYDNIFGLIKLAKATSAKMNKAVFISVIDILGGTTIDPKFTDTFPFIQPIITGGTIDFRQTGGFYVTADTPDQEIIDKVHALIRAYSPADQYLANLATQWSSALNTEISEDEITKLTSEEERYFTIIARIRAIPPQKAKDDREEMKRRLLSIMKRHLTSSQKDEAAIQQLLFEVSKLVKKYEYDKSIPLQVAA